MARSREELEAIVAKRWRIGGVLTAVMMLAEEGKLSLDGHITEILEGLPQAWSNVTVRHLLNHTSGIKSYTSTTDFFKSARKDFTKEEIIKLVADLPVEFKVCQRPAPAILAFPNDGGSVTRVSTYVLVQTVNGGVD